MTHRIDLDTVRKHRNASEWRNWQRARCGDLECVGEGRIIVKLAGMMLERGMKGPVEIYRDKTPVFLSGTVEQWASGSIGRGEQPPQLRKEAAE